MHVHVVGLLACAGAAILQLDKTKQQEKEDALKRALNENDARHDEHLKTLESRIAVCSCLPAHQIASQPNCVPARPSAYLPVLEFSTRAYVGCERYEGRERVTRVCTYMQHTCMYVQTTHV